MGVAGPARAQDKGPNTTLTVLPVREITVFKDGHAFVLREGDARVNGDGSIILGDLPNPVLGTFWPFAADKNESLRSAVASREIKRADRPAVNIPDFLAANIGASVLISETNGKPPYRAVIVDAPRFATPRIGSDNSILTALPDPSSPDYQQNLRVETAPETPQNPVVALKTTEGMRIVQMSRIDSVTFVDGASSSRVPTSTEDSQIALTVDGAHEGSSARVGVMYLQDGLRWIPNYKVTIDGKGTATVQLQATLIDDLTDMQKVTMHLVVGIPSFRFADQADPIGLQDAFTRLSRYFQQQGGASASNGFSNAIMTQQANGYGRSGRGGNRESGDRPSAEPDASSNEDQFVYTLKNITLMKGQRMTLSVLNLPIDRKV